MKSHKSPKEFVKYTRLSVERRTLKTEKRKIGLEMNEWNQNQSQTTMYSTLLMSHNNF